jgi:predicted aspartyl protease
MLIAGWGLMLAFNLKIATAVALLAAALMLKSSPVIAEETCRLLRIASVDSSMDRAGGLIVPMKIGSQSVSMLVDTGGIITGIRDTVADRIGLRMSPMAMEAQMRMYGGARISRYTIAPEVELGGLKAQRFPLIIMPGETMMGSDIDGILAPNVLSKYEVEFDFANARLNLFTRDHCEGQVVYWTTGPYAAIPIVVDEHSWHLTLPVMLDGHRVRATIDTGSSRSILSWETAKDLFSLDEKTPGVEKVPGSDIHAFHYPFKSLAMQGVNVADPDLLLVPDADSHMMMFGEPPMILGMGVLRQLHLFLSYKEKVLYATPASAH